MFMGCACQFAVWFPLEIIHLFFLYLNKEIIQVFKFCFGMSFRMLWVGNVGFFFKTEALLGFWYENVCIVWRQQHKTCTMCPSQDLSRQVWSIGRNTTRVVWCDQDPRGEGVGGLLESVVSDANPPLRKYLLYIVEWGWIFFSFFHFGWGSSDS